MNTKNNKFSILLLTIFIIANTTQLGVYFHGWIGNSAENDGFYASYPIILLESFAWFVAGLFNIFLLVYSLIKRNLKIGFSPLVNFIGILPSLLVYLAPMVDSSFVVHIDISLPIHYSLKLISIVIAVFLILKIKK